MEESERPSSEIALKLGIRRNQLYKWKEQLEAKGEQVQVSHLLRTRSALTHGGNLN